MSAPQLTRQIGLLNACWDTFDAAAKKAARATLKTRPRGGGRQVSDMIDHVCEADRAYTSRIAQRAKREKIVTTRR